MEYATNRDKLIVDERLKNLKIQFPQSWVNFSLDNPNGPPTFIDGRIEEPGVLQISTAEFLSGPFPNPNGDDLIGLS